MRKFWSMNYTKANGLFKNGNGDEMEKWNELFEYQDGKLFWKVPRQNGIKPGDLAGGENRDGYWRVMVNRKVCPAHRIIWEMFNSPIRPGEEIDHVNGNPAVNRIENLRIATHAQNTCNRRIHKNNKSGHPGVSWNKATRKWRVHIMVNRKQLHLGCFALKADAIDARFSAEQKHFGEFAPSSCRVKDLELGVVK